MIMGSSRGIVALPSSAPSVRSQTHDAASGQYRSRRALCSWSLLLSLLNGQSSLSRIRVISPASSLLEDIPMGLGVSCGALRTKDVSRAALDLRPATARTDALS